MNVNFKAIPDELKAIPQWLVWTGDKVPYDAKTHKPTGVTWNGAGSNFDVTRTAYETGQYKGVGFILSSGIVGIDLDHCIDEWGLDDWADDILSDFFSYTEISPS